MRTVAVDFGGLMLPLGPVMLIVMEAEPVEADTALTDIARELPLDRLAAFKRARTAAGG